MDAEVPVTNCAALFKPVPVEVGMAGPVRFATASHEQPDTEMLSPPHFHKVSSESCIRMFEAVSRATRRIIFTGEVLEKVFK